MVRIALTAVLALVSALALASVTSAAAAAGARSTGPDQTWTIVALVAVNLLVPVVVIAEVALRRFRRR